MIIADEIFLTLTDEQWLAVIDDGGDWRLPGTSIRGGTPVFDRNGVYDVEGREERLEALTPQPARRNKPSFAFRGDDAYKQMPSQPFLAND